MSSSHDAIRKARRDADEAIRTGEHFIASLQAQDVEVSGAELAIEVPVAARFSNSGGSLLGGITATMIDLVAGRLAMEGLPEGHRSATNDMTVHFLAPVVKGPARAEGRVLRRGLRSVVVAVDIRDLGADRLAAVGIVSFTVLAPLPEPSTPADTTRSLG